jgi:hypothetical protein
MLKKIFLLAMLITFSLVISSCVFENVIYRESDLARRPPENIKDSLAVCLINHNFRYGQDPLNFIMSVYNVDAKKNLGKITLSMVRGNEKDGFYFINYAVKTNKDEKKPQDFLFYMQTITIPGQQASADLSERFPGAVSRYGEISYLGTYSFDFRGDSFATAFRPVTNSLLTNMNISIIKNFPGTRFAELALLALGGRKNVENAMKSSTPKVMSVNDQDLGFRKGTFLIVPELSIPIMLAGNVFNEERASVEVTLTYSDGTVKSGRSEPANTGLGGYVEWFAGKHIGLVAGYSHENIEEKLSVGGGNYESKDYSGNLLPLHNPYIGVDLASLNDKKYNFFIGIRGGYLTGALSPYPVLFQIIQFPQPVYSVSGFNLGVNVGLHVLVYSRILFSAAGSYKRDFITFPKSIYNAGENVTFDRISLHLSFGLII